MLRVFLILFFCCFSVVAEIRTWTLIDRSQFKGELIAIDLKRQRANIRLGNQNAVWYTFKELSTDDLQYILSFEENKKKTDKKRKEILEKLTEKEKKNEVAN